jgi:hypothetical protein
MNRMTRGAVAAALAATVALGASAPAAVAGPKADHAKATHKTVKATKADKAKSGKVDRTLSPAERRTLRQAKRKQGYLDRLLDSNKLDRLGGTAEDAVRKNIEDDIAELETFITAAAPVAGDTAKSSVDVGSYRPEVYHTIINQLRLATRLQAAAGELTEGTDPAAVPSLTELGTLATELMTYDAQTKRSQLRATQRTLSAALAAIEEADESEDETETGTETGTEAGTTTEDAS